MRRKCAQEGEIENWMQNEDYVTCVRGIDEREKERKRGSFRYR